MTPMTRPARRAAQATVFYPEEIPRLQVCESTLHHKAGVDLFIMLQGLRLAGGAYAPMAPDSAGAFTSERLGLRVFLDGWRLGLADVRTGERLLGLNEVQAAASVAEAERAAAEAENARLRAEIARLRAETDVARVAT